MGLGRCYFDMLTRAGIFFIREEAVNFEGKDIYIYKKLKGVLGPAHHLSIKFY